MEENASTISNKVIGKPVRKRDRFT
jgi:hypothetical protein